MKDKLMIKPSDELAKCASGMLMMAFFTSIWSVIAYSGLKNSPYKFSLIFFLVLMLVFAGYAFKFLKTSRRYPEQGVKIVSEADKRRDKWYMYVFIAEGLGIFIGINVVIHLGYPNLVIPVLALVVGLHFFPLARIFKRTQDYYIAAWSTTIAICGMVFSIYNLLSHPWVITFVGVGMAAATSVYGCSMFIRGLRISRSDWF